MASIWKLPNSPFWAACFNVHTSADVLRWKRSVKTANHKLATQIANALEDAGRGAMDERAITSFVDKIQDLRARKATQVAFADVFKLVAGREMGAGSLRAFSQAWLKTIEPQIAPTSYLKYKQAVEEFVRLIGEAADRELLGFGNQDDGLVVRFRDHLHARLAPSSVNDAVKIVRQMFKSATERFEIENPAAFVRGIKKNPEAADRRRAFTLPEIGRILRVVKDSEWEGIVLCGLYTGLRLSDIVRLRWENVDLVRGELALTTRKTKRRVLVPLAPPAFGLPPRFIGPRQCRGIHLHEGRGVSGARESRNSRSALEPISRHPREGGPGNSAIAPQGKGRHRPELTAKGERGVVSLVSAYRDEPLEERRCAAVRRHGHHRARE
ncbi:MAG: hypothetical protein ABI217_03130 [Chthoniobacterales bacterium]